jgi:hypothetical protein
MQVLVEKGEKPTLQTSKSLVVKVDQAGRAIRTKIWIVIHKRGRTS